MPKPCKGLFPFVTPVVEAALACALLGGVWGCADRIEGLIDCEEDEDCPSGYCDQTSHFCFSGPRQCTLDTQCGPPARVCQDGTCQPSCLSVACALGETCNTSTGRCRLLQSCDIDSHCQPPVTVCVDGYCEAGCSVTGCLESICDPYSGHCQGTAECSSDAECSPPSTVCEGTSCVPGCLSNGCDGVGEACSAVTGRCEPVAGCTLDSQCSPPSTVCEGTSCVPGCLSTGCDGVGETCNQGTGRCELEETCTHDSDCAPPGTICEGTHCVAGCGTTGCTSPATCNASTGRCETSTLLPDGADCAGNASCLSGLCRHVEVYHGSTLGWLDFDVCTTECCTELDCAVGSACLYHHGAKICIPDRIYPTGYTFNLSAGQACGSGTQFCRSGFCNPESLVCARSCCEGSDCGGDLCSWYNDGTNLWELCRAQGSLGFGTTGTSCSSEYDCQSFVCLGPAGTCANLCCSNIDCPGGYRCAQVLGQAGSNLQVTTACASTTIGTRADGTTCTPGDAPSVECASGLCAAGTCRSPCCHDADCAGGQRCTTVPSGIDVDSDGQSDWVRACMP